MVEVGLMVQDAALRNVTVTNRQEFVTTLRVYVYASLNNKFKSLNYMKQKLHILFVIAVVLLGLTACQKSTKDQLVGTWHYVKTMTIDGNTVRIEGTDTNNEDGTYSSVANAVYTFDTEIEGVSVQIKAGVSLKGSGEWTVNDKEIVTTPTSVGIKVTSLRYYDPSDDSFIGELTGNELKEASNAFADEIKEGFLEASTERIIMLKENKYVTESTDEDGGKTTFTFNRLK